MPAPATGAGAAYAEELVRTGRFDEVLAVPRSLAQGLAVDVGVLFQLGLAAFGVAQTPGVEEDKRDALLDEAMTAFRTMLVRDPDLPRVRLELAHVNFLKGEDDRAREQFERVLAGRPPELAILNVHCILAQIRARRR